MPDDLLKAATRLEVDVAHDRPPGAAWARHVMLFAYVDPGPQT